MNVLILTAGFGEGHNTAARNIRRGLEIVAPEVNARVVDVLEITYPKTNALVRGAYLGAINRTPTLWNFIYQTLDSTPILEIGLDSLASARKALLALIEELQPASIVSTYPLYNYLIQQIYGDKQRPFSQITVVTDSLTINSLWHRARSDYFLVANDATLEILAERKVPRDSLRAFGFPVACEFGELAKKQDNRGIPVVDGPGRVLLMLNPGREDISPLVRALGTIPNVELTVTTGKDQNLREAVERAAVEWGAKVETHGWTPRIPELIARSHLLVSKAGGATVQEAVAAKCLMIISQVVPGQEEGNARLLMESGAGCLASAPETMGEAVRFAFADSAKRWKQWEASISELSRPTASLETAKFILNPN